MTDKPIDPDEIERAADAIPRLFRDSPLVRETPLDEMLGCRLALKVETLNPIRSFKARGTEALFSGLTDRKPKAVIATSTGNFGQGIAWSARQRGIAATILVPEGANPLKLAAMRRLGADVVPVLRAEGDGKARAAELAAATGALMIEDGAHPEIAIGAGTIGFELSEAGLAPEILVIQLGDGALAAGIGAWLRARSPRTRIVGVVATGAPAMQRSLAEGRAVSTESVDTIADGMAIRAPIASSVELLRHCIDEVVAVDDAAILDAARLLLGGTGILAEPSGAAGLAAIMTHRAAFAGRGVAAVVTGSNLSPDFQRQLLQG